MTGAEEYIRRLPLVPAPMDDEPLPSFLPRLAAEYRLPFIAILEACGFDPDEMRGYGVILGPEELMSLHLATGIPISRLQEMLLMSLHGTVADLSALRPDDGASLRAAARHTWLFFSGSFACPDCLRQRQGAWRLRWKTPWVFACSEHSRLMLDTCPQCETARRSRSETEGRNQERREGLMGSRDQGGVPRFRMLVPQPGHCTGRQGAALQGRAARPCGFPLWDAETLKLEPAGRVLSAQATLERVLDEGSGSAYGREVASVEYLKELRGYASLLLRFAESESPELLGELPDEPLAAFDAHARERDAERARRAAERRPAGARAQRLFGTAVPREAAVLAAVLPAAVEVLKVPEADLSEAVVPITRLLRSQLGSVGRSELRHRFAVSPTLTEALVRAGCSDRPTLRRRRSQTQGLSAKPARWGAAEGHWENASSTGAGLAPWHVPELFWSPVYEELFAELFSTPRPRPARIFLSLLLIQRTWKTTWQGAAQLLGRDDLKAAMVANGYTTRLQRLSTAAEVIGRLDTVSDVLARAAEAGRAVDYRQRKRVWPAPLQIAPETWRALCLKSGVHPGRRSVRRQLAGTWVWAELTGLDPFACGRSNYQVPDQAAYTNFLYRWLPPLRAQLELYAAERAAPQQLRPFAPADVLS